MIEATGLTKRYGRTLAVDDLSFTVRPGRVTGFLGPNGAGKSTTMRMMLGLDRPNAGDVRIDGRRYTELTHPLHTVGALLDATWIHPHRSARAHLRWLARSNRIPAGRVDEVLGLVGLTEVAGKRAGAYSLSMSQRLGIAAALLTAPQSGIDDRESIATTQFGLGLGSYIAMVLAAITITSEYRFGTIRATFAAVPNRTAVLLAKTAVVTVLLGLVGLVTAFAAWGVAYLVNGPALAIDTASEWRLVAGQGLLYAGYAIIAIGVGLLIKHTAGAISLLLVWALVVEHVVLALGYALDLGMRRWMPFANADHLITAGDSAANGRAGGLAVADYPFGGPWGSFGYFTAVAITILVIGIVIANRRDA